MKRLVLLATAALVAMLILVPIARAQQGATIMEERMEERTTVVDLPQSGGEVATSVLLPAAALLLGSGVLSYALVRRR